MRQAKRKSMKSSCFGLLQVAVLLIFCVGLPAAAERPSATPFFAVTFSGTVTDPQGKPAAGVEVEVIRDDVGLVTSCITDAKGRFRCEGARVTAGDFRIFARSARLGVASTTVSVTAGQGADTFTADLRLERYYTAARKPPRPPSPPPVPGGPAPVGENNAVVKVFYATDRERASAEPIDYGPKRGSGLVFGRFDVSIPRDHRLAHIERPSIWRFEFREDPNKHFVIVARKEEKEAEFYGEVADVVAKSPKRDAFVFIHGYNVSFDDAVYRTAQLAYDLGFQGAPILYSWPSNGEVLEYTGDLNNNDWTVPHLEAFLQSVATQSHAATVHLIAHSMGNRALSNALNLIAVHNVAPLPHFREVVLTAPDIDADTFKALAQSIESTADHVTLYASANDKALQLSKRINGGYRRAGDATADIVVVTGMDTIDASALETDFLGHSYFGDRTSVLSDIFALLTDGTPPDHRFGLHRTPAGQLYYWKFLP